MATDSAAIKEYKNDTSLSNVVQFYRRPLPDSCVDFTSRAGKAIFSEALSSGYMECYFKLVCQFRTQDEPAYCGITSLVMTLNALEVDPGRVWKGPWRWYHETMLDCCIPLEEVRMNGINMVQFVCLAKCNGLHAKAVPGNKISSLDHLRSEVKRVTEREDVVFIASYSRKALGQTGTGHFSPIAGYHEGKDMVLILDTARFKYPPHWVKLQDLLDGMRTIDQDTGKPRGYVLLSLAKDQFVPLLFRPSCALTIDSKKGLHPDLLAFDTYWKGWLQSQAAPGLGVQCEDSWIVNVCLEKLLTMPVRGHFDVGTLCLNMPFRIHLSEANSYESYVVDCNKISNSVRAVYHMLKSLLLRMELTKTFQAVQKFLSTRKNEESELFLKMVQYHSELSSKEGRSNLYSDCSFRLQEESKGDCTPDCSPMMKGLPASEPQAHSSECICGCCNGSNEMTASRGSSTSSSPDVEQKCQCNFTIKPEHVATMFLFVWPHKAKASPTCESCRSFSNLNADFVYSPILEASTDNGVDKTNHTTSSSGISKERASLHDISASLSKDTTGSSTSINGTLSDVLSNFLQSDLDALSGTHLKGEINSLMTKFHEVLHYHCQE